MSKLDVNEEWFFHARVGCTDRGKHASRELAWVRVYNEPWLREALRDMPDEEAEAFYAAELTQGGNGTRMPGRPGGRDRDYQLGAITEAGPVARRRPDAPGRSHPQKRDSVQQAPVNDGEPGKHKTGWRFRCPSCKRDYQIGNIRFRQALIALAGMDVYEVDISLVP